MCRQQMSNGLAGLADWTVCLQVIRVNLSSAALPVPVMLGLGRQGLGSLRASNMRCRTHTLLELTVVSNSP